MIYFTLEPLKNIALRLGVSTGALVAFTRDQNIAPVASAEGGTPLFDAVVVDAAVEANHAWFADRAARVSRQQAYETERRAAKIVEAEERARGAISTNVVVKAKSSGGKKAPRKPKPLKNTPPNAAAAPRETKRRNTSVKRRREGHTPEVFVIVRKERRAECSDQTKINVRNKGDVDD